jgi:hypothetical protein
VGVFLLQLFSGALAPPASMRSSFNPFTAIGFGIGVGFGLIALTQVATAQLSAVALRQCALRDWPAHKDAAMTSWCSGLKTTYAIHGRY